MKPAESKNGELSSSPPRGFFTGRRISTAPTCASSSASILDRSPAIGAAMRLFAPAVVAAVLTACLDSGLTPISPGPDDPYLGPRSTCSTGPAYPNEATFPEGPRESRQPVCTE